MKPISAIPQGLLPARPPETHKGDLGHVFVIAGSEAMTGAGILCSLAALRTGAGLVTLAVPKSLHGVVASKVMEVITRPFPETKTKSLSLQALPEMLRFIEQRIDVVAIGPGLSEAPQTQQLVRRLLPQLTKPCVIDADGLNALVRHASVLNQMKLPPIVTPHPGEMARLFQRPRDEVMRKRQHIAKSFATSHRSVTVLKGYRTVVANIDGQLSINETGNPGMATAGAGDVLTGMIAGLLGQRLKPFDAARLGVYLHGLAGDLAAAEQGQVGLIASDLLATIPRAIRRYQGAVQTANATTPA